MNRCPFIQPIRLNLRFGVDLQKLFPPWYLHPSIKNLLYLVQTSASSDTNFNNFIESILYSRRNAIGTTRERLLLKERLVNCKDIFNLRLSPGVPFWLLRHLLGLLPKPIFTPDGNKWIKLSEECNNYFLKHAYKKTDSTNLEDIIARELASLCPQNITLLLEIFELFRYLSISTIYNNKVDKRTAELLACYFSSSLFLRPYRPGIVCNEHQYIPLVTFIIYNWNQIREKSQKIIDLLELNSNKFYYLYGYHDEVYFADATKYLTDKVTQTEQIEDAKIKPHNYASCSETDNELVEKEKVSEHNKNIHKNEKETTDDLNESKLNEKIELKDVKTNFNVTFNLNIPEKVQVEKKLTEDKATYTVEPKTTLTEEKNISATSEKNIPNIKETYNKSVSANIDKDLTNLCTTESILKAKHTNNESNTLKNSTILQKSAVSNKNKSLPTYQEFEEEFKSFFKNKQSKNKNGIYTFKLHKPDEKTIKHLPKQEKYSNEIKKNTKNTKHEKKRPNKKMVFSKNSQLVIFDIKCRFLPRQKRVLGFKKLRRTKTLKNTHSGRKHKNSTLKETKIIYSEEKLNEIYSPEMSIASLCYTPKKDDYVYDSFIGSYKDESPDTKIKINIPVTCTTDDLYPKSDIEISSSFEANDYEKYQPKINAYKFCYDNETFLEKDDFYFSALEKHGEKKAGSFQKFKSTLSSLKGFSPKKLLSRRYTTSFEHIFSNVKYERLPRTPHSL